MMTISRLSASIEQSVMYNQLGLGSGMQRLQTSNVLYRAYRAMSDWPSQPLSSFLVVRQSSSRLSVW